MTDQLEFNRILVEAEEQHRATLDRHREHVQNWFDQLSATDKQKFADWFATFEWDTCAALAAAAGDYRATHVADGK